MVQMQMAGRGPLWGRRGPVWKEHKRKATWRIKELLWKWGRKKSRMGVTCCLENNVILCCGFTKSCSVHAMKMMLFCTYSKLKQMHCHRLQVPQVSK